MHDTFGTYIWLCLSAMAAGIVNTLAGGGTILTFPALMAATHLPVVANVTSTVALLPGSFAGAWAFRQEVRNSRSWLVLLAVPSVLGGIVGSLLVTRLDSKYFEALVPWLIFVAAMLFALQPMLARRFLRRAPETDGSPSVWAKVGIVVFQFFVAVYGGYFGAGIGILMLSALGLMGLSDIRQMNGVKNVLAACINGISAVVFMLSGKVIWPYTAMMAVSAVLGAYLAGRLARRVSPQVIRRLVTAIGFGLAGYYFFRQFRG